MSLWVFQTRARNLKSPTSKSIVRASEASPVRSWWCFKMRTRKKSRNWNEESMNSKSSIEEGAMIKGRKHHTTAENRSRKAELKLFHTWKLKQKRFLRLYTHIWTMVEVVAQNRAELCLTTSRMKMHSIRLNYHSLLADNQKLRSTIIPSWANSTIQATTIKRKSSNKKWRQPRTEFSLWVQKKTTWKPWGRELMSWSKNKEN